MAELSRNRQIQRVSLLSMGVNLIIAAAKVTLGLLSNSIAVISEGINNATDALSGFLSLLGAKLSAKHPDEKHPFGYGRVEYLSSLVIGGLILYSGIELLKEAIDGILHPSEPEISALLVITVLLSAVVKFFHGVYTIKEGKRLNADALTAVGTEGRNDAFFSLITLISMGVFLIFHVSLDAYAAVIFAVLVLKNAFETLKSTLADLLGRPGKKELADALYSEIRRTPGIINAADLMLHCYGPESYSGSVNIEMDHRKTLGEIYQTVHDLQLRLMESHHVTMVFGLYAVDEDSNEMKQLRMKIAAYVRKTEHVLSYHAVYVNHEARRVYCDLVVDYKLRDWDKIEKEFGELLLSRYPGYSPEIVIETEYV